MEKQQGGWQRVILVILAVIIGIPGVAALSLGGKALPGLFPEKFKGGDLSVFGLIYETEANGNKRDLPIGLSRRTIQGVERAWFNWALSRY